MATESALRPRSSSRSKKREGSPWTGLLAVVSKEMADHLTSARMRILEILIVLTAAGTVFTALQSVKDNTARDPLPAFAQFLGFLVPLIAIALAFDSINGEFSRRTMSRVLAQPIYR